MSSGLFDWVFTKAGAFRVYDTLPVYELLQLGEEDREVRLCVDEYITGSFAALANQDMINHLDRDKCPLSLREVLLVATADVSADEDPMETSFVRDIIRFNKAIVSIWKEKGYDMRFVRTTIFRSVEFYQLQQNALAFQQMQDNALQLAWPRMHLELATALNTPAVDAPLSTIRAFLNNPENHAAIEQVSILDLKKLGMEVMPREIERFTGLRILDLSQNQISYIPSYIPDSVEELALDFNCIEQIENLPASIVVLGLGWNLIQWIEKLPPGIKELSLRNNAIAEVPEDLPEGLQFLYLDGNSIERWPLCLPMRLFYTF